MDSNIEPLETLPENLLEEIKTYYPNVSYERYGHPVTPTTKSIKTATEVIQSGISGTLIDLETFEPFQSDDIKLYRSYVVRIDQIEGIDYVYAVYKSEVHYT